MYIFFSLKRMHGMKLFSLSKCNKFFRAQNNLLLNTKSFLNFDRMCRKISQHYKQSIMV